MGRQPWRLIPPALIARAERERWTAKELAQAAGCCLDTIYCRLQSMGVHLRGGRQVTFTTGLGPDLAPATRARNRKVVGFTVSARGGDNPEIGQEAIARMGAALRRIDQERAARSELMARAKTGDVMAGILLRAHHHLRQYTVEEIRAEERCRADAERGRRGEGEKRGEEAA